MSANAQDKDRERVGKECWIMNERFLSELLEEISVSGYEEPVQAVVKKEMKGYAHEVREDDMGNVVCVLNPESDIRIMLSAHADEIGLIVSNITDTGRLQVIRRGGIVGETYPGQQVCVRTAEGMIYGVVEGRRDLFEKKELKESDLLIDIGAKSREEALQKVAPGDPIVRDTKIRKMMNGRFTARALDDRLGVFIIMEALKRAKEKGCSVGVYAASTTGEETTKTGAYWTSSRIQPTLAVVVDVTYCSDYEGINPALMGRVELGNGPVLCNGPYIMKKLNSRMKECAHHASVPVQIEVADSMTHTDGDLIHFSGQGVPVVLVSIPLRYMHMPAEVADEKDVEGCIELIAEFLASYEREL